MTDKRLFFISTGLLIGGALLFSHHTILVFNTEGVGLIMFGWGIVGAIRGLMS